MVKRDLVSLIEEKWIRAHHHVDKIVCHQFLLMLVDGSRSSGVSRYKVSESSPFLVPSTDSDDWSADETQ